MGECFQFCSKWLQFFKLIKFLGCMKMTESCLQIEIKMAEACFFENENIFAGFIGLSKGALKSRSNRSSSCARKFDPNLSWKIPRFRSKKPAIVSTFVTLLIIGFGFQHFRHHIIRLSRICLIQRFLFKIHFLLVILTSKSRFMSIIMLSLSVRIHQQLTKDNMFLFCENSKHAETQSYCVQIS